MKDESSRPLEAVVVDTKDGGVEVTFRRNVLTKLATYRWDDADADTVRKVLAGVSPRYPLGFHVSALNGALGCAGELV